MEAGSSEAFDILLRECGVEPDPGDVENTEASLHFAAKEGLLGEMSSSITLYLRLQVTMIKKVFKQLSLILITRKSALNWIRIIVLLGFKYIVQMRCI